MDHITAGGVFVTIDFCLSILGTILNVIIVATIKNSSYLLQEQYYSFLASLGLSNIIITSFNKLLSSVLCGHAVAKNLTAVPFQFCNISVVFSRLTWIILPYTVFFISWLDFLKTVKYKYLRSDSIDFESSSFSRKSVDEQGILTQRYLILKEYQYIQIIKSLKNSQQNKKNSVDGVDSLHSIKNKWMSKIKTNKKMDSERLGSISRKWKENTIEKRKDELRRRRVMKQKSKSFDDELELEPSDRIKIEKKQSYSCSEIPQLYSIKEEGNNTNISQSKTYRRKMFAKSRTQQVTMSFSSASSIKSLKSSNASLSSCDPRCIITLSSPESTAPPILIFPDSGKKGELRKQVSFENSLDGIDQPRGSQVSYRNGRATTSMLSSDTASVTRKRSVTSNTSTVTSSSASVPDLKYILVIWSLGAVYTMIDEQLVKPSSQLCSVADGSNLLLYLVTRSISL